MKFLIFFVFTYFMMLNLKAEQINSNRSWSSFSYYSQMVQDSLVPYERLGRVYRGIFILQYDHVDSPLIAIDDDRTKREFEIVRNFQRVRGSLGHFITDRLFVGASVPYDRVKSRQFNVNGDNSGIGTAPFEDPEYLLGDISLVLKYRISPDDWNWHWSIIPMVSLPTGDEKYFNTDDGVTYGASVALSTYFDDEKRWRFFSSVGYESSADSRLRLGGNLSDVDTRQRVTGGLGINYRFSKFWAAYGEVRGFVNFPFDKDQNPVEGTLGLRFHTGSRLTWFAGFGLEGLPTDTASNDSRFIVGLKYLFNRQHRKKTRIERKVRRIKKPLEAEIINDETPEVMKEIVEQELNIFRDIKFQTNSAKIKPSSYEKLNSAASTILKHIEKIGIIQIEGHTDSRGPAKYNRTLSQKRAQSVVNYLVGLGIERSKLKAVGKGEDNPINPEESQAAWAQNRRVEFVVNILTQKPN